MATKTMIGGVYWTMLNDEPTLVAVIAQGKPANKFFVLRHGVPYASQLDLEWDLTTRVSEKLFASKEELIKSLY